MLTLATISNPGSGLPFKGEAVEEDSNHLRTWAHPPVPVPAIADKLTIEELVPEPEAFSIKEAVQPVWNAARAIIPQGIGSFIGAVKEALGSTDEFKKTHGMDKGEIEEHILQYQVLDSFHLKKITSLFNSFFFHLEDDLSQNKWTLLVVIAATACLFFLMIVVLTGFAQTGKKLKGILQALTKE